MIRARVLLIASIACGLAPAPASAGIERAGTTAANFLALGSGPAVLAMGGAGLALDGGLAAFDWNPATLARLGRTEAVFSHAALGEQNGQEWAGVGSRLRFAGLSGAVTGLFQHEGSFEGRDALNNPTGSFDVSSVAVGVGIARAVGPFVTAGLGINYAGENLGGVRGSGVALDAGLQVRLAGFGFGAAAQNAFGKMKYDAASYDFPASYGLGVSYEHTARGLRVALDMNFPAAYYNDIRGGLEWRWNDRFALRTGYRAELGAASGEPLGGPTFGMGAGAGSMWLDYGYLVGGTGAGQHRIGITYHPGANALQPDGPEHRGRELGHASTDVPGTDTHASAPTKPRASTPESAPAASSASVPASASASSGKRAPATGSAPAMAAPPASAPASMPVSSHTPASSPAQSAAASVPASASAPATSSPSATAARTGASAAPPASAAANAPVSSPAPASTAAPAGAAARPSANASVPSSPRASTPASAGATAAGPLAAQVGSAPPSYAQRAKAARGTGETSANDRKTAALAPTAAGSPHPPVAPQASNSPPAAAKRDSTAAPKSGPAPVTKAPAPSPTPAPNAAARPDSAAARASADAGSAASPPPTPAKRPERVRVKNGQTMSDIARAYGTSVPAIMMENNMVTDRVHSGQVLKLPRK
jgi:LysM repeat protein